MTKLSSLPVFQCRQFYSLCVRQKYHKIWPVTGFRDESPPQAKFCDTFVARKGKQLSKLKYLNDQNLLQANFLTLRSNAEIAKLSTLKTLICHHVSMPSCPSLSPPLVPPALPPSVTLCLLPHFSKVGMFVPPYFLWCRRP